MAKINIRKNVLDCPVVIIKETKNTKNIKVYKLTPREKIINTGRRDEWRPTYKIILAGKQRKKKICKSVNLTLNVTMGLIKMLVRIGTGILIFFRLEKLEEGYENRSFLKPHIKVRMSTQ